MKEFVYTAEVVMTSSPDGQSIELILCGACLALGQYMVKEKKPNFRDCCQLCGRTSPDLRPTLKPVCDCRPAAYKYELGHRKDRTGEQVPCILLVCAREKCMASFTIDFDWPTLGKPIFRHTSEGH